jgi:hypothetical protein
LIPKLTVAKTREERRSAEIGSSHRKRIPHEKWGTLRLSPDFHIPCLFPLRRPNMDDANLIGCTTRRGRAALIGFSANNGER